MIVREFDDDDATSFLCIELFALLHQKVEISCWCRW